MNYNIEALTKFKESLKEERREWVSNNALNWANYIFKLNNVILNRRFKREDLLNNDLKEDLTNEELSIAILSWGGMNREHGKSLFKNKEWLDIIKDMRYNNNMGRIEAYNRFKELRKKKKLKGMGPAFFTKLICFVNPHLNGYIMDQWTSKSVNILLDKKLVKLSKKGMVTDSNTPENYNNFCEVIEDLSTKINKVPIDTEEALFSFGGYRKGMWRKYVIKNWQLDNVKSNSNKHQNNISDNMSIDCTDMEPLKFQTALDSIHDHWIKIKNLGNRSEFEVRKNNHNTITIKNSNDKQCNVYEKDWNLVLQRMKELPSEERLITSRYSHGDNDYNWRESPNRNFSPYIPAIIKHIININNQHE